MHCPWAFGFPARLLLPLSLVLEGLVSVSVCFIRNEDGRFATSDALAGIVFFVGITSRSRIFQHAVDGGASHRQTWRLPSAQPPRCSVRSE